MKPLPIALLFLAAAGRLLTLGEVRMNHDEVRSVSRTMGTLEQIAMWQPADWPPLYYWTLAGWRALTGIHPLTIRLSSVLLFLLACALMYRLGVIMFRSERAGQVTLIAYAALGFTLFMSSHVRGYALVLTLFPAVFLAVIAMFRAEKRWWLWSVPVGGGMAAMFLTTYTSVLAFPWLVLYPLFTTPRRIWRWIPPGVLALLIALPEITSVPGSRVPGTAGIPHLNPAGTGLIWYLRDRYFHVFGPMTTIWTGVFVLATLLVVINRHRFAPRTLYLILWVIGGPLLMTTVGTAFGLGFNQYSWWLAAGFALWVGYGLSQGPRLAQYAGILALIPPLFVQVPQPALNLGMRTVPFEDTLPFLQTYMEPGDVLLIDPMCEELRQYDASLPRPACGFPEEWDYYQMVYFPDRRLHVVDTPGDHQRVWYLKQTDRFDDATESAVRSGRVAGPFVGPGEFLFQLFSAPPDQTGIAYENGMRLHGTEVIDQRLNGIVRGPVTRREGEHLRLRLWWSVDAPLDLDYAVSVAVSETLDAPALAQIDGAPELVHLQPNRNRLLPAGTSAWEPGEIYIQEVVLKLPNSISPEYYQAGDLPVSVTVYQWWDGEFVRAPGVNGVGRLPIETLRVLSY